MIEPASEMMAKRAPAVNILDFGINFQNNGMNPIKFMGAINYNYNITQIISKTFKKLEKLDRTTVSTFFKLSPKKINTFNHSMDKYILSYHDLPYNDLFVKIQKEIKYAKESKNEDLMKQMKKKRKKLMNMIH